MAGSLSPAAPLAGPRAAARSVHTRLGRRRQHRQVERDNGEQTAELGLVALRLRQRATRTSFGEVDLHRLARSRANKRPDHHRNGT